MAESSRKVTAKRKRQKVLEGRREAAAHAEATRADLILGSPLNLGPSALYEGSRLQKAVLKPEDVWYTPPPDYASGQEPEHYLHGLSAADRELLFGALPHATAELAYDPERPAKSAAQAAEQHQQTQTLQRILDLRNASRAGIDAVNRQRIIAEFGRKTESGGIDSGSSQVQAALITHKIRNLWNHVEQNNRDKHNRKALRVLVHKRAKILKYFKRKHEHEYDALLKDLGLVRSAVEGELVVGM